MRWGFGWGLWLLIAGTGALGQEPVGMPSLSVKGDGADKVALELTALEVSVEAQGRVVETVLEMTFFNHTGRNQEGEFSLALPTGATVSTYALEVDGAMRAGVSVEKEQARHAYETIKRRNIDPGLVERQVGNVYRTRIFPILAKQPKRVRIGFIQTLGTHGRYELPLVAKDPIERFGVTVSGVREAILKGVTGGRRSRLESGAIRWAADTASLDGALMFAVPQEKGPLLLARRQPDGATHFILQGVTSAPADREWASQHWRNLRIVWDASRSGQKRDHAKELTALDRLWKWLGQAEVEFIAQGYGEPIRQEFAVSDGAAPELSAFVKGLTYDGSADFSKLATDHEGVTLLVTDGLLGTPIWGLEGAKGPHFVMTHGRSPDPRLMGGLATWLDLSDEDGWWKAVERPRSTASVAGIEDTEWDFSESGERFVMTGRLPKDYAGSCQISVGGKKVAAFDPTEATPVGEWHLARRYWAQRRLARMERSGGTAAEITEFAIGERLVSDHTSLIVLERFEDHVTFRIPPPEPDLLAKYQRRVDRNEDFGRKRLVHEWDQKVRWWHQPVSWVDPALSTEMRTVGIWIKASRLAFPEPKRNVKALRQLETWLTETAEVTERAESLKTRDDYTAWKKSQAKRLERLSAIRDQTPKVDSEGRVHVSIRGRLPERGIYSASGDATLWSIFDQPETSRRSLNLDRVYLYRDGQRTGYNLTSDQFEPPPLQWGDMIVVEDYYSDKNWGGSGAPMDPFADPFMETARDGRAVFEPTGTGGGGRGVSDPFGAPVASPDPNRSVNAEFVPSVGPDGVGTKDGAILAGLRSADELEVSYLQRLSDDFGGAGLNIETVVEIARLFFEQKQPDRGEAILSNLLEFDQNPVENLRAFAFWLAEFGNEDRAVELVTDLAAHFEGEAATQVLLTHDIGQLSGSAAAFHQLLQQEMEAPRSSGLGTIALTDFVGRGGLAEDTMPRFTGNGLPSDLRIVVTSAGGDVVLEVEPEGELRLPGVWQTAGHPRVQEWQARLVYPVVYKTGLHVWDSGPPVTVRITYHLNWGRKGAETRTTTRLLAGGRLELEDISFDLGK